MLEPGGSAKTLACAQEKNYPRQTLIVVERATMHRGDNNLVFDAHCHARVILVGLDSFPRVSVHRTSFLSNCYHPPKLLHIESSVKALNLAHCLVNDKLKAGKPPLSIFSVPLPNLSRTLSPAPAPHP